MPITTLTRSPIVELLLRNSNYALYSAGNAVSLIGMWMQRIAIGWLTWQLTESGFWLGVVAFADFIPVILIGPIAGAAADRWDRLNVIKISQFAAIAQASTLFWLTASGLITIELLVALAAFQGCVVAFGQPARLALVPSLVPEADLRTAVAVNSIVFNLARFVGPACAGPAIVWGGLSAAFAANAVSYLAVLAALFWIRVHATDVTARKRSGMMADVAEGFRYTTSHPGIAAMLVLLTAIGFGSRPLTELLPGFAANVFNAGAGGLSTLASAMGAGAILGGLWIGQRAHSTALTPFALGGAAAAALSAVIAVATNSLSVAVPALMAFGFFNSTAGIAIQSSIQLATERAMRGRVMGLYGLLFRGAPAIGALAAGTASTYFGLRVPIFFGVTLVLAACVWLYMSRDRIASSLTQRVSETETVKETPSDTL